MDFKQLILEKKDQIIEQWVVAVRQDGQIESADNLTFKALRDSLPDVLEALGTVLSRYQEDDQQALIAASLEHGNRRAEQGFDPTEIAREYGLLRQTIITALEPELLQSQPESIVRVFRLVEAVVDEAIAQCFKSYTEQRLQELEKLQEQLSLNNQELTRLVHDNQDNLSHLAHELKTPLTSIIGYAELFLRQHQQTVAEHDPYTKLEHIDQVVRSGRQLLHLINDALELSRYEAGKLQLHLQDVEPAAIVTTVTELVAPMANAKGLELRIKCDQALTQVVTDPLRLRQIMTNLVSNAVRYTDTGFIQVSCQQEPEQRWSFTVTDTGIGIALDDQDRIFEPYVRLGSEQRFAADSTGLGLAITDRLIKLLQGTIVLTSAPAKGSTFTVVFPLEVKL